jgi:hypothetical protein
MASAAAKSTAVVTADELLELSKWETKYAKAEKDAAAAKKELAFRRIQLAEKVLGIKSADELKELAPEQIEKRLAKRLENGDWRAERGAPEFSFVKTNAGRYPAWSQLFVQELGETMAARIRSETPLTYSYCVEVTLP